MIYTKRSLYFVLETRTSSSTSLGDHGCRPGEQFPKDDGNLSYSSTTNTRCRFYRGEGVEDFTARFRIPHVHWDYSSVSLGAKALWRINVIFLQPL